MGKTYKDAKEAKEARRFRNKAKRENVQYVPDVATARKKVDKRTAIRFDAMATVADRKALQNDWQNREGGLGDYWKAKHAKPSAVTITKF